MMWKIQAGALIAVYFAKRGFKVDVYEARKGNVHGSRKYLYPPNRRSLEKLKGGGTEMPFCLGKYEAKLLHSVKGRSG